MHTCNRPACTQTWPHQEGGGGLAPSTHPRLPAHKYKQRTRTRAHLDHLARAPPCALLLLLLLLLPAAATRRVGGSCGGGCCRCWAALPPRRGRRHHRPPAAAAAAAAAARREPRARCSSVAAAGALDTWRQQHTRGYAVHGAARSSSCDAVAAAAGRMRGAAVARRGGGAHTRPVKVLLARQHVHDSSCVDRAWRCNTIAKRWQGFERVT
jgi:hypothetical protein